MKRSGVCPKCQSTAIITAIPLDRDNDSGSQAVIATYGDPDALIFKDRHTTTISAHVCQGCGYTELYADAPSKLTTNRS